MKAVSVQCNHCGAPLKVAEDTRFATCSFCDANLKIEHSNSAVFSRVLEKVERRTEEMGADLEILKIESALERLEREWEHDKGRYEGGSNGAMVPTRTNAKWNAMALVAIGLWMVLWAVAQEETSGFLLLGGLAVVGFAVVLGRHLRERAVSFEQDENFYRRERERLLDRLDALQAATHSEDR